MPRIVALDTNILTWALKEKATLGQEEMIPRCQAFLEWLDKKGDIVLIPEIVVSELLMDLPEDQHTEFLAKLDALQFLMQPHDRQASLLAARMWGKARPTPVSVGFGVSRKQVRVDILILAAAIAGQASVFYTNNIRDFLRFSEGFRIQVSDIPLYDELKDPQLLLFGDEADAQITQREASDNEEDNAGEKFD